MLFRAPTCHHTEMHYTNANSTRVMEIGPVLMFTRVCLPTSGFGFAIPGQNSTRFSEVWQQRRIHYDTIIWGTFDFTVWGYIQCHLQEICCLYTDSFLNYNIVYPVGVGIAQWYSAGIWTGWFESRQRLIILFATVIQTSSGPHPAS
jgi:hypothetical protein